MRKKLVALAVAAVLVGLVMALILSPAEKTARTQIYHVRLADPNMYEGGVFSDTFEVKAGTYQFRFVPNGDSPRILSISLEGQGFSFSEDFELEGTEHDTGISRYYTWDYLGTDTVVIPGDRILQITVNPHGNVLGPVSVYLIE